VLPLRSSVRLSCSSVSPRYSGPWTFCPSVSCSAASLLSNYVYNEVVFSDTVAVFATSDGSLVYARPNVPFNLWYGDQDLGSSMAIFFQAGVLAREVPEKPASTITFKVLIYWAWGGVQRGSRTFDGIIAQEGTNFEWSQEGTYNWKADVGTGDYRLPYVTTIDISDPLWDGAPDTGVDFYLSAIATTTVAGTTLTSQAEWADIWTVKRVQSSLVITDIKSYVE